MRQWIVPLMVQDGEKTKVAVLGGGVGSLVTVMELTNDQAWRESHEVTVYQLGWRLGGKGASGRNLDMGDRIEEHGVHMWMGFYRCAFQMMQLCYEELGRPPDLPLATMDEAFVGKNTISFHENIADRRAIWEITFPVIPGKPADAPPNLTVWHLIADGLAWLIKLLPGNRGCLGSLLTFVPAAFSSLLPKRPPQPNFDTEKLAKAHAHAVALREGAPHDDHLDHLHTAISDFHSHSRDVLGAHFAITDADHADNDHTRRLGYLVELAAAVIRGVIADDVFGQGYKAIDGEDFVAWLVRHGASKEAAFCAPVRAVYDAMFAYADGNPSKPSAAAGTVLHSGLKTFLGYYGHLYYQMQAGMGDAVFAPIYEVLKERGVRFEFFSNIQQLLLDKDKKYIETINVGRQATVTAGSGNYQPLFCVKDLPCWPDRPLYSQLTDPDEELNYELPSVVGKVEPLTYGKDFDLVVLGIPLGALPTVCADLINRDDPNDSWSAMIDNVGLVATSGVQLWFGETWSNLGWDNPPISNSGYPAQLSVWANTSDLICRENWKGDQPQSLTYLCSALWLRDGPALPVTTESDWQLAATMVQGLTAQWLAANGNLLWPDGTSGPHSSSLNLALLYGSGNAQQRFNEQYFRPNVTPSELYVLSLPDSGQYRLKADQSGYENLVLTGDWIDNEFLCAGFIEGATVAGIRAAEALRKLEA